MTRGAVTSARFVWACDFIATPTLINAEMEKLADVIRRFAEEESLCLLEFDLEPMTIAHVERYMESLSDLSDEETVSANGCPKYGGAICKDEAGLLCECYPGVQSKQDARSAATSETDEGAA